MSEGYRKVPTVALRGMTILPGMVAHFDVSRNRSIKAVENAMMADQTVFLITQKDVSKEEPEKEDLYAVGVLAVIKQVIKLQNNVVRVLIEGENRAHLLALASEEYLLAEVAPLEQEEELPEAIQEAMLRGVQETLARYCRLSPKPGKELARQVQDMQDLSRLLYYVGNNLPVDFEEKQKLLEAETLQDRYETLMITLLNEINIIQIKAEFQSKVKEKVDKNQKEYILREQMRLIREELGEDNTVSEADNFLEEMEKLDADQEVKDKLKKEIERFKNVSASSSESAVIRGYIETLLEMPWNKASKDNKNLENAERALDEDHYGMEKVKERMLEFLAVRNLTAKGDSPIICLVGPPGTGKTSIARSVARALDKKYIRISLGGVRDEAEIRGHRKTYVGAMPGRIITAINQAQSCNPLILLDEIDKLGYDHRGDPSSALLEVLDGEQNSTFRDNFLEIPFDLSQVMFITTANTTDTIPRPLLDRMEVIELTSYTDEEKLQIARRYLLPKQMKEHGVARSALRVTDEALRAVITGYTRESGVRSLERQMGKLCRKTAMRLVSGESKRVRVAPENLEDFLGVRRYLPPVLEQDPVGVVNGLAWTESGGELLEVEVNAMEGAGKLELTGNLGDVMKESAQAAVSCIRSRSAQLELDPEFYKNRDIHIHFPEGAVPKDGPSAGIAITTAVVSALTGRKVRSDIAMTGEVTLRGRVLAIGGLKEKTMAAKRSGIHTVIIPRENQRDLTEIDPVVRESLRFITAETIDDVLPQALCPSGRREELERQREEIITAFVPVEQKVQDGSLRQ